MLFQGQVTATGARQACSRRLSAQNVWGRHDVAFSRRHDVTVIGFPLYRQVALPAVCVLSNAALAHYRMNVNIVTLYEDSRFITVDGYSLRSRVFCVRQVGR